MRSLWNCVLKQTLSMRRPSANLPCLRLWKHSEELGQYGDCGTTVKGEHSLVYIKLILINVFAMSMVGRNQVLLLHPGSPMLVERERLISRPNVSHYQCQCLYLWVYLGLREPFSKLYVDTTFSAVSIYHVSFIGAASVTCGQSQDTIYPMKRLHALPH